MMNRSPVYLQILFGSFWCFRGLLNFVQFRSLRFAASTAAFWLNVLECFSYLFFRYTLNIFEFYVIAACCRPSACCVCHFGLQWLVPPTSCIWRGHPPSSHVAHTWVEITGVEAAGQHDHVDTCWYSKAVVFHAIFLRFGTMFICIIFAWNPEVVASFGAVIFSAAGGFSDCGRCRCAGVSANQKQLWVPPRSLAQILFQHPELAQNLAYLGILLYLLVHLGFNSTRQEMSGALLRSEQKNAEKRSVLVSDEGQISRAAVRKQIKLWRDFVWKRPRNQNGRLTIQNLQIRSVFVVTAKDPKCLHTYQLYPIISNYIQLYSLYTYPAFWQTYLLRNQPARSLDSCAKSCVCLCFKTGIDWQVGSFRSARKVVRLHKDKPVMRGLDDGSVSIEELLKDEVVKQEMLGGSRCWCGLPMSTLSPPRKAAEELMNVPKAPVFTLAF